MRPHSPNMRLVVFPLKSPALGRATNDFLSELSGSRANAPVRMSLRVWCGRDRVNGTTPRLWPPMFYEQYFAATAVAARAAPLSSTEGRTSPDLHRVRLVS